jgi:ATP/maltotriose-dependent transcriptional regulator MalT
MALRSSDGFGDRDSTERAMNEVETCETYRNLSAYGFPLPSGWARLGICADRESPALPPRSRSRLELARAWQSLVHLQGAEALAIVQRIERQLDASPASATMATRCEIAAVKAAASALRDDGEAALASALAVLRLGSVSPSAHVALTVCRFVYWRLGDLDSFHAVERPVPCIRPARLRTVTTMLDLALHAAVEFGQMRFHSARLLASDALDAARCFGDGAMPIDWLPACVLAQLMYEEGRLAEAEALMSARLASIRQGGSAEAAIRVFSLLARIAINRQQPEQARALLAEAEELAATRDWPRLQAASLALQVELHISDSRFGEAERLACRLAMLAVQCGAGSSTLRFDLVRHHLLAQTRLALACMPDGVDLAALRRLHDEMVARRDRYSAVPVALLTIEALLVAGHRDAAAEVLGGVLKQGADAGLCRTFIDCGERVAGLIDAAAGGELAITAEVREQLPYARALMARRRHETARKTMAADPQSIARPVATLGLSEREHDVLGLMGSGLTNKQIAIRLKIAPETVKSYAKHLYVKLGAKNRTEASMLASRLGLLQLSRSDVN